ncbi:hypothetical protein ES288_A12G219800v1, partial [Gossypium darwinii]
KRFSSDLFFGVPKSLINGIPKSFQCSLPLLRPHCLFPLFYILLPTFSSFFTSHFLSFSFFPPHSEENGYSFLTFQVRRPTIPSQHHFSKQPSYNPHYRLTLPRFHPQTHPPQFFFQFESPPSIWDRRQESKSKSTPNLLITKKEGLELYEDMVLGRAFEDKCAKMYYDRKMLGFVHLYNGQEAVSTGFIRLLKQQDSIVCTYRDHVQALSKGLSARAVMSELLGKATGCCRGQGGSMHIFSRKHNMLGRFAFIGEGIPIATGAAFTSKYKREVLKEADCGHVSLAFFGDGTCNNGQFYECLNMAALWKLPIVFVVENNLWAIGMSHLRATSVPQIYKKGPAFGMPGVHVDGMDVLKVREVAKEAIGRARRGEGPTLVECETYRFRGHSLADPDKLRDPAEKAHYAARDPITALKKYLIENSLANEADLKAIDKR